MTWSMVLIYLVIGSSYRLSLMGAFTAPVASALLIFAVALPPSEPVARKIKVNPWLEAHTSFSMVACGAFALACIAGVMFLVQERQLKTRPAQLDFLPTAADHGIVGRKLAFVMAGFQPFHGGAHHGISDRRSDQLGASSMVDPGLVRLWRHHHCPDPTCHGRDNGSRPCRSSHLACY